MSLVDLRHDEDSDSDQELDDLPMIQVIDPLTSNIKSGTPSIASPQSIDRVIRSPPLSAINSTNSWFLNLIFILSVLFPAFLLTAAVLRFDIISLIYLISFGIFMTSRKRNDLKQLIVSISILVAIITLISRIIFQAVLVLTNFKPNILATLLFSFLPIHDAWTAIMQFLPEVLILIVGLPSAYYKVYQKRSHSNLDNFIEDSEHCHRNKKRRLNINASLMILIMILTLVAVLAVPNILSAYYLVWIVFELFAAVSVSSHLLLAKLREFSLSFSMFQALLIYIFQIPPIASNIPLSLSRLFGLFVYFRGNTDPCSYSLACAVFLLPICICIHSMLAETRPDSKLVAFHKEFKISSAFIFQTNVTHRFFSQVRDFLKRNASKFSAALILCLCTSFPSLLTLPLLLWACAILISRDVLFPKTYQIIHVYQTLLILLQYVFNSNPEFPNFKDIGLLKFEYPFYSIGLQLAIAFASAVLYHHWGVQNTFPISSSMSTSETSSVSDILSENYHISKFWGYTVLIWTFALDLLLKYAYLISILVLYICALQEISILNAVFVLYFVLFMIFPYLARKMWMSLLIYTEVIIVLQFIYQFSFVPSSPDEKLWGLHETDNLWALLQFHLIILLFAAIQMNTFELLDSRFRTEGFNLERGRSELQDLRSDFENLELVVYVRQLLKSFKVLLRKAALMLCFTMFSVNGFLGNISLFGLGYVFILFFCLLCYQLGTGRTVRLIWIFICCYPAFMASALYVFQFPKVEAFFDILLGPDLVADIGLQKFEKTGRLFTFLLQHVITLCMCVFQFRIFYRNENHTVRLEQSGTTLPITFSGLKYTIDLFKRVIIIHMCKVSLLFLFLSAISIPSLVGLFTLFCALSLVILPKFNSSGRWLLMLLAQIIIIAQMTYQLRVIQSNFKYAREAAYIGFVDLKESSFSILPTLFLIYSIALETCSNTWKRDFNRTYPELSTDEREWPLLLLHKYANSFNEDPAEMQLESKIKTALKDLLQAVDYWFSNFFTQFGFETCLFAQVYVSVCRSDIFGSSYLLFTAIFMFSGKHWAKRLWSGYMFYISVMIIFQYVAAIGLPFIRYTFPWYNWSYKLRQIFGIPAALNELYVLPDFILLCFCSCQQTVFKKREHATSSVWRAYELNHARDFTDKPRTTASDLKLLFMRYFIWLASIFLFFMGTVTNEATFFGFIFLAFSLYYIFSGERLLLRRKTRLSVWRYVTAYTYMWFLSQNIYPVMDYILRSVQQTDWDNEHFWPDLIGFNPTYRDVERGQGAIIDSQYQIALTLFALILIQNRINCSSSMKYVVRYLKRDAAKAERRAYDYHKKRTFEVHRRKRLYEEEIFNIREKVAIMKNYQYEVNDWVELFGRRADEYGYAVVGKTESGDWGIVDVDMDDGFLLQSAKQSAPRERVVPSEQLDERAEAYPIFETVIRRAHHSLQVAPISNRSKSIPLSSVKLQVSDPDPNMKPKNIFSPLGTFIEPPVMDFQESPQQWRPESSVLKLEAEPSEPSPPPVLVLKEKKVFGSLLDSFILCVYRFASDYTEFYATESQAELIKESLQGNKIMVLLRGFYFAICSHSALVSFIAIYINQIHHGDILSTVPTVAVLVWGMIERPYPGKKFWTFVIVFIELTVFLKYFFQFSVWSFNGDGRICTITPKTLTSLPHLFGISKTCGSFFVEVITELLVLMCCIAQRGLMRRLGLWSYSIDRAEDVEPELAGDQQMSHLRTGDAAPDMMRPDDLPSDNIQPSGWKRWYRAATLRYSNMLDTSLYPGKDYYVAIFVSDFVVFLLTIISYTFFSGDSSSDSNINFLNTVFNQNTVPPLFVAILVLNFCFIIADRAIYTSKSIRFKFILQLFTVIAFTSWIFFILPSTNGKPIYKLVPLQVWFFAKCVYWHFSGLQVKNGYPRLRIYNFLMRNYTQVNRISFLIYRLLPFVWELRAIVDWTLSSTSLDLYNFLKFEDIYASIYLVKCQREADKSSERRFGETFPEKNKKLLGACMLFGLIILLWFPLIFMSIPGTTKLNPASSVTVNVQIDGFYPFYTQTKTFQYITTSTPSQLVALRSSARYKNLLPSYYSPGNLQFISFPNNSMSVWSISPESLQSLIDCINSSAPLYLSFQWTVNMPGSGKISTNGLTQPLSHSMREKLLHALSLNTTGHVDIFIPGMYPKLLHGYPNGMVSNLDSFGGTLANATLRFLYRSESGLPASSSSWWELTEMPDSDFNNDTNPNFGLLSDSIPAISSISSYGVIGLYVVVVFAVGKLIRSAISGLMLRIMYEDLPNPDIILDICRDIILAREFGDFETEEMLFWQLITLYRSPALLLQKTRIKND